MPYADQVVRMAPGSFDRHTTAALACRACHRLGALLGLFALLSFAASAGLAQAQPDSGAARDVARLLQWHARIVERLLPVFQEPLPSIDRRGHASMILARLEAFESGEQRRLEAFVAEFAQKYGADVARIQKALRGAGWRGPRHVDPGARFAELVNAQEALRSARASLSKALEAAALADWAAFAERGSHPPRQVYEDLHALLDVAARFDPEREPSVRKSAVQLVEASEGVQRVLDERDRVRAWPGDSTDFVGPGSSEDTRRSALAYFRERGEHPAGIAIRGAWTVRERDGQGGPLHHALPVYVAFQSGAQPEQTVVLAGHLITAGPDKDRGWVDHEVEDSFTMLTANLPVDALPIQPAGAVENTLWACVVALTLLAGSLRVAELTGRRRLPRIVARLHRTCRPALGLALVLSALTLLAASLLRSAPLAHLPLVGAALAAAWWLTGSGSDAERSHRAREALPLDP